MSLTVNLNIGPEAHCPCWQGIKPHAGRQIRRSIPVC